MFDPLRRRGLEIHTPPWITPSAGESLAAYAARLADTIRPDFATIGGASFGGMLALELARLFRPRNLVLLGSAANPHRLAPGAKLLERLARPVPDALARRLINSGSGLGLLGATSPEHRALLLQMARDIPVQFIRWGARAIMHWPGVDPGSLSARLLVIHGARDRLIRPPADPAAHLIPAAGHVFPITHPERVAEILHTWIHESPKFAMPRTSPVQ